MTTLPTGTYTPTPEVLSKDFQPTYTPTVLTSSSANNNLNTIKTQASDINTGIQNQASKVATDTATKATADTQAKAQADAQAKIQADIDAKKKELEIKQQALKDTQGTTLAEDQAKAANQGKPGYDALGNPIPGYTAPESTSTADTAQAELEKNSKDLVAQAKAVSDSVLGIQNGTIPLSASENAMIDNLKQQYQQMIDQQIQINKQAEGTAQISGARMGGMEYDANFQAKTISSILSAGQSKISSITSEMTSAVNKLTQAIKNDDIAAIKSSFDMYQTGVKARTDELQKIVDDAQKQIKEAQDAKIAAEKTYYDQVTKPIQDIQTKVAENFAPKEVLTALKGAKTVDEALAIAGDYMHTATGDLANYIYYKYQAEASGSKPMDYNAYLTFDANRKAAATAGVSTGTIETPTGVGVSTDGGSILSQTGLSIGAFNYLTQGTASMARMPAAQRNAIMQEAEKWSKRTGQDISTFQSQYKAYNDTLSKNINRMNNTKIMENEIVGTLDNLSTVATDAELGKINYGNILKIWAGQNVNDPIASKYAFHFQQLKNELAGYFAASQGKNQPDVVDNNDADRAIKDGLNKKSLDGLREAIEASTGKMSGVMQNSVDASRKAVWDLFGVGSKYQKGGGNASSDQMAQDDKAAKTAVDSFIQSNPMSDAVDQIAKFYESGTYSDSDINDWLKLRGYTK